MLTITIIFIPVFIVAAIISLVCIRFTETRKHRAWTTAIVGILMPRPATTFIEVKESDTDHARWAVDNNYLEWLGPTGERHVKLSPLRGKKVYRLGNSTDAG